MKAKIEAALKQQDTEELTKLIRGDKISFLSVRFTFNNQYVSLLQNTIVDGNLIKVMQWCIHNKLFFDTVDTSGQTPLHYALRYNENLIFNKEFEPLIRHCINMRDVNGKTPLHIAVENRSTRTIELLISLGADLNIPDQEGNTAIFLATRTGNIEIVKLVFQKSSVNDCNNTGKPLLYQATDNMITVKFLIEKGANINQPFNGETPLHLATSKGNYLLASFLLNSGADANLQDNSGKTPLHIAVERRELSLVRLLLNKGNVNISNSSGQTILDLLLATKLVDDIFVELAAEEIMKFSPIWYNSQSSHLSLLDNGLFQIAKTQFTKENINFSNKEGNTALHIACSKGQKTPIEFIKNLLDLGANIELQNCNKEPPLFLYIQAFGKNIDIDIAVLLSTKFTVNAKNLSGIDALYLAVVLNLIELVPALLPFTEDINHIYDTLGSLLHVACRNNSSEMVKILIDGGADINIKDYNRQTPLQVLPTFEKLGEILEKIDVTPSFNSQDLEGNTILHKAVQMDNNPEAVKILLSKGANVNIKNIYGLTPLLALTQNVRTPEICILLLTKEANLSPEYYRHEVFIKQLASMATKEDSQTKQNYLSLIIEKAHYKNIYQIYKALESFIKEPVVIPKEIEFGAEQAREYLEQAKTQYHLKCEPYLRLQNSFVSKLKWEIKDSKDQKVVHSFDKDVTKYIFSFVGDAIDYLDSLGNLTYEDL